MGHSLGGRVALAARQLAPAAVGEVVLLDISPGPLSFETELDHILHLVLAAPSSVPDRQQMRGYFTAAGVSEPLADWLILNLVQDSGAYHWRIERRALEELHHSSRATDLWPAIVGAGSPTRCIRGERSRFVGDADAARLTQAGCRVDTLADAGHFVHVDQPAQLLDLLCPE